MWARYRSGEGVVRRNGHPERESGQNIFSRNSKASDILRANLKWGK